MQEKKPTKQNEDIRQALAHIPADDRDTWYRMAMAIKSKLGEPGFALWDEWSQTGGSYNAKSAKAVWKGIKATGPITIASLFHEAMHHGYKPATPYTPPTTEQRAELEAVRAESQRLVDEHQRQQRGAVKAKAVKQWEAAEPVQPDHPYIASKRIKPVGARQLKEKLVLPLRIGDELVSLQFISEDGSKRFCTDGQVKGTALVLGQLDGADTAILCEGWATGCSLHEATAQPVVVAWNAGNLPVVAEQLAKRWPSLALIVAGDCDVSGTGQAAAMKAASMHRNAMCCAPVFTEEQRQRWAEAGHGEPSDFNDLHQLAGLDAVWEQLGACTHVGAGDEKASDGEMWESSTTGKADSPIASTPDAADEEAYLCHLATLRPLAYARIRKAAGEALGGIPLGILDKLVSATRKELQDASSDTDTGSSGTSVVFDDVEPWPTPVNGAAVLNDAFALLCRYVIADRETLRAAALWCALTWYADYATVLPLALITAPEKGCGKSTLLAALAKLASRPLWASNVTPAALFRAVEHWKPSLFIDEADTFMKDSPELVGVINSGHTRDTAYVIRTVGDSFEPRQFSTWGAKAISGIGAHAVAETITSRSVIMMMRRKLPGECCDSLRHCDRDAFHMVKRQFARWSDDHGETFAEMRPTLEGLSNRTADNWEPLLALADLAGGDWPKLARQAAVKLTGSEDEAPSFNQELLGDIKAVFERLKIDRIHTNDLLEELCKDEESAWATYNRGRPFSPRQLSKRLGEFGVKAKQIKIRFENRNGYELSQFTDAFTRYLSSTATLSSTPLQPAPALGYSDFSSSTVRVTNNLSSTSEPAPLLAGRGVEDKTPLNGGGREREAANEPLHAEPLAKNAPKPGDDSEWEMAI